MAEHAVHDIPSPGLQQSQNPTRLSDPSWGLHGHSSSDSDSDALALFQGVQKCAFRLPRRFVFPTADVPFRRGTLTARLARSIVAVDCLSRRRGAVFRTGNGISVHESFASVELLRFRLEHHHRGFALLAVRCFPESWGHQRDV